LLPGDQLSSITGRMLLPSPNLQNIFISSPLSVLDSFLWVL
jgi:hypothetical protein